MLYVTSTCVDHTEEWQSQPMFRHIPAGNVLLTAAILFSGCPVAAFLRALASVNVQAVGERTFYYHQKAYLLPAVRKVSITRLFALPCTEGAVFDLAKS